MADLIRVLDPEPTAKEMCAAMSLYDGVPPDVIPVQRLAELIAAHRVRERRVGIEWAAKINCVVCMAQPETLTEDHLSHASPLTGGVFCDCSSADIWSALAAHDAAIEEREKGNG